MTKSEEFGALAAAIPEGPFYAHENDLVGGWCVGTCDGTPASGRTSEETRKSYDLGDFMGKSEAEFLAWCGTHKAIILGALILKETSDILGGT